MQAGAWNLCKKSHSLKHAFVALAQKKPKKIEQNCDYFPSRQFKHAFWMLKSLNRLIETVLLSTHNICFS